MSPERRKILVVDDDVIVRQSLVAYLEDSGFEVLEAGEGKTALTTFNDVKPELLLVDFRMPGMDGLDLLEHVHGESPHTPVVMMSGVGGVGDVVRALRLGAADFLLKPLVDLEVLYHSIMKCLERSDLLAENQRYREELERANSVLREHLRTLEKDQEAGRQVQQRLLPPNPFERGEYRLEHKVIPSLFLSGDFIDIAFRNDRFLSFYLSDVAGHGASSAFTTIWLKHATAEIISEWGLFSDKDEVAEDFDQWFSLLNQQLLDSRLNHHLTCMVGLVDIVEHRLYYAIAGHLPLPVMITSHRAMFLQGSGRPLGLFPNQQWRHHEVEFPPGATLAVFSDGILEVVTDGNLIEKEQELLSRLSEGCLSMTGLCEQLGVESLTEAPDDIAILTVSRRAQNDE